MEIEEIIFSKKVVLNVQDPFVLSLRIMEMASELGEIVQKKNTFQTDGPVKRSIMHFDVVKNYDDFTKYVITVELNGEMNLRSALEMYIKGSIKTRIEEDRFFSSVFAEFYLQNIYQTAAKKAKNDVADAGKRLEKSIQTLSNKG